MADQNPCIMVAVIACGIILAVVIMALCCCPGGEEMGTYGTWPGF